MASEAAAEQSRTAVRESIETLKRLKSKGPWSVLCATYSAPARWGGAFHTLGTMSSHPNDCEMAARNKDGEVAKNSKQVFSTDSQRLQRERRSSRISVKRVENPVPLRGGRSARVPRACGTLGLRRKRPVKNKVSYRNF